MKSVGMTALAEALPESRREALLNLLTDDDRAIYLKVREKIISLGPESASWLRRYTLSNDACLRRRAQEIVDHFDRQAADNRFLAFCLRNGEELDLEQAALMLAQTRYPAINIEGYHALIDNFARAITRRITAQAEPASILEGYSTIIYSRNCALKATKITITTRKIVI